VSSVTNKDHTSSMVGVHVDLVHGIKVEFRVSFDRTANHGNQPFVVAGKLLKCELLLRVEIVVVVIEPFLSKVHGGSDVAAVRGHRNHVTGPGIGLGVTVADSSARNARKRDVHPKKLSELFLGSEYQSTSQRVNPVGADD